MRIGFRCGALFISLQQVRIETDVVALAGFFLQRQIKRHMVDTGATIAQRGGIEIEIARQLFCRALHGVAQPDLFDVRIARVHRPGIHRHGVHVVKHRGIRADLGHVFTDLPQVRNGAQGAHNAARAERIGNGLFQSVAFADVKIGDGTGFVSANLEGNHHEVRPFEGAFAVGVAGDIAVGTGGVHQFTHHNVRLFQTGFIDIHQGNVGRLQRRTMKNITKDVFDKNRGARADKGNFGC